MASWKPFYKYNTNQYIKRERAKQQETKPYEDAKHKPRKKGRNKNDG